MSIKRKLELGGLGGLQSYESYIEPAGDYGEKLDVLTIIGGGENLSLELEREPTNRHDPNAIKIIGVVHGQDFENRYHVGYLPATMAKKAEVAAILRMVQMREYTHYV